MATNSEISPLLTSRGGKRTRKDDDGINPEMEQGDQSTTIDYKNKLLCSKPLLDKIINPKSINVNEYIDFFKTSMIDLHTGLNFDYNLIQDWDLNCSKEEKVNLLGQFLYLKKKLMALGTQFRFGLYKGFKLNNKKSQIQYSNFSNIGSQILKIKEYCENTINMLIGLHYSDLLVMLDRSIERLESELDDQTKFEVYSQVQKNINKVNAGTKISFKLNIDKHNKKATTIKPKNKSMIDGKQDKSTVTIMEGSATKQKNQQKIHKNQQKIKKNQFGNVNNIQQYRYKNNRSWYNRNYRPRNNYYPVNNYSNRGNNYFNPRNNYSGNNYFNQQDDRRFVHGNNRSYYNRNYKRNFNTDQNRRMFENHFPTEQYRFRTNNNVYLNSDYPNNGYPNNNNNRSFHNKTFYNNTIRSNGNYIDYNNHKSFRNTKFNQPKKKWNANGFIFGYNQQNKYGLPRFNRWGDQQDRRFNQIDGCCDFSDDQFGLGNISTSTQYNEIY